MVNNTVNGKKVGRAAGKNDMTVIFAASMNKDNNKELNLSTNATRRVMQEEYISIKAYPGGNPTKSRRDEGLTH